MDVSFLGLWKGCSHSRQQGAGSPTLSRGTAEVQRGALALSSQGRLKPQREAGLLSLPGASGSRNQWVPPCTSVSEGQVAGRAPPMPAGSQGGTQSCWGRVLGRTGARQHSGAGCRLMCRLQLLPLCSPGPGPSSKEQAAGSAGPRPTSPAGRCLRIQRLPRAVAQPERGRRGPFREAGGAPSLSGQNRALGVLCAHEALSSGALKTPCQSVPLPGPRERLQTRRAQGGRPSVGGGALGGCADRAVGPLGGEQDPQQWRARGGREALETAGRAGRGAPSSPRTLSLRQGYLLLPAAKETKTWKSSVS